MFWTDGAYFVPNVVMQREGGGQVHAGGLSTLPDRRTVLPASLHLSGRASCKILLTSSRGTAAGAWPSPASARPFSAPAGGGAEAADEELAKATGVRETARARPAGVCGQRAERAPRGPRGRTDERRGAGAGRAGDLTPVDGLFLRTAAERLRRRSGHSLPGGVSLSSGRCPPCGHLDMRINSRIVPVVGCRLSAEFEEEKGQRNGSGVFSGGGCGGVSC